MWKTIQRIVLLCLVLSTHNLLSHDSIDSSLKQLSIEERFFLRTFFRSLFKYDDFGHVVFFETKPACLCAIDKKCSPKSHHQKLLLKGWECWKKYEELFPHPNFVFLEEDFVMGDEIVTHIFVINKKSLTQLIQTQSEFFKKILGEHFSIETFLTQIENKHPLRPLLQYDEALLGMILGFGVESPLNFKCRTQRRYENDIPEMNENYRGVEATAPHQCKLYPIAFVGNPKSDEVIHLLNQYSQELDTIWKLYRSSKDPLKLALSGLMTETVIEQNPSTARN